MRDVQYVNNTGIIAQNPKMTAINSCIEIDLTGQVVSDSIGTRMYSGETYFSVNLNYMHFFSVECNFC
jgi:acyl-CoA hydrolase